MVGSDHLLVQHLTIQKLSNSPLNKNPYQKNLDKKKHVSLYAYNSKILKDSYEASSHDH
ncbi:hypothetical protein HanRHA438_Chr03g0100931 [Helianthus annuus]|nr:hypothetical protein HanIR_Chr12g0613991 [Helianthus annuus]KAJ0933863.1 hypothetical protein HanRHA438_Chr03g0100931 [Helianthus annuus]